VDGVDTLLNLRQLVDDFFLFVQSKSIEIYNEFSLQHELGIFLREKLPDYRIQFERNVVKANLTRPKADGVA